MKKTGGPSYQTMNNKFHKSQKKFKILVKLQTDEVFPVKDVHGEMKIREVKSHLEFCCGLPYHLQRLHYLDEADLQEHTDLRHNDIVPGAVLMCDVWPMWLTLLQAVAADDIDWLFRLGVSQTTDYRTPHSDYMTIKSRRAWIAERAVVALIMAVHRGHVRMIEKLIAAGANVNGKTPLGRTPLHIAAGGGHGQIVDLLLHHGADFNTKDNEGNTASTYAQMFGHKDCERHLFLFQWQQRAANTKKEFQNLPRMAHQYHDSKFPVWLSGTEVQLYYTNILPPGEFEGTAIDSRKKRHRPTSAPTSREDLHKPTSQTSQTGQDSQVDVGDETLKPVRKQTHSAGKQRDYITSLQARASKTAAATARLSADARRRLNKEPSDADMYGMQDIDDKDERHERVMNSAYGRGLAYSRIYGHRRRSCPRSFDDWVRLKTYEKTLHQEKLRLEEEAAARKVEERRRHQKEKRRELEDWLLEKTSDATRLSNKAVVDKVRNTFREGRDLSTYDLWIMKKEVEASKRVPISSDHQSQSVSVT